MSKTTGCKIVLLSCKWSVLHFKQFIYGKCYILALENQHDVQAKQIKTLEQQMNSRVSGFNTSNNSQNVICVVLIRNQSYFDLIKSLLSFE